MRKYLIVLIMLLFSATEVYATSYPYQQYLPKHSKDRAIAQEFTDRLDKLYEKGKDNEIFSEISSVKDYFYLSILAEWLHFKISSGDARFNYYYASSLFRMSEMKNISQETKKSLKETAITMALLGRVMILIDGERCKDKHIAYLYPINLKNPFFECKI